MIGIKKFLDDRKNVLGGDTNRSFVHIWIFLVVIFLNSQFQTLCQPGPTDRKSEFIRDGLPRRVRSSGWGFVLVVLAIFLGSGFRIAIPV